LRGAGRGGDDRLGRAVDFALAGAYDSFEQRICPVKKDTYMSSENVLELDDASFESEVLSGQGVALVDFWAEWCLPCKMLGPTIEEIADDYAGKIKVAKVDIDNSRDVASKLGIQAIPTVILFKDGDVAKKFVGLQQKNDLAEAIDEVLE
jgi:thioredoxin 1